MGVNKVIYKGIYKSFIRDYFLSSLAPDLNLFQGNERLKTPIMTGGMFPRFFFSRKSKSCSIWLEKSFSIILLDKKIRFYFYCVQVTKLTEMSQP